ncbi:MAG: lyase family protein [Pyrodictiaceae archaeon]
MPRYREITGIDGEGLVYKYTSSIEHDKAIERHVAFILAAHLAHLYEKGLVPRNIVCELAPVLLDMVRKGNYIRKGFEDVFEAAEAYLEERAGDAARFLWIGRSRNDHVSAALRIYTAEKLIDLLRGLLATRRALIGLASQQGRIPIILHTHQQPSQVGTVACLALSWEKALSSITQLVFSVLELVMRSPLGMGAGAGTFAPLDPERLAELAGLGPVLPAPYAVGSRLDLVAVVLVASLFLAEASRIAGDLIHYSSPYLGALRIPDEHVATSSAMPHKRNPVTLEVLRARAARVAGYAVGALAIMHGLPYTYNLDLQEANLLLYNSLRDAIEATRVLADVFKGMSFNEERLRELIKTYAPVSVELAEALALRKGKAFRETYAEIAKLLRTKSLRELAEELLGPNWVNKVIELRQTGCGSSVNLGRVEAGIALDEEQVSRLAAKLEAARKRIEGLLEEVKNACTKA